MKRHAIAILVVLSLFFSDFSVANAVVTPGSKCAKAGVKQSHKGKVYTCIKLGKKLYWNNGTRVVTTKSTPTPRPTPTPTSTQIKAPGKITNLSAEWREATLGPELVFSFEVDLNLPENSSLNSFEYGLTAGASVTPRMYSNKLNKNDSRQEVVFTYANNTMYNGIFEVTFTEFYINALNKDGSYGPTAKLTNIPTYASDLCTPIITGTSISMGYRITLAEGCLKQYEFVSVEEIVSEAVSAPSAGYLQVYLGRAMPANILTPTTQSRWVKARYTSKSGLYGKYSNAIKIKPANP